MFANAEYPKHESLSCCDSWWFFQNQAILLSGSWWHRQRGSADIADINAVVAGEILFKKNQSLEEWKNYFSAKNNEKVDSFDIFVFNKVKLYHKIKFCQPNKAVLCVKVLSL